MAAATVGKYLCGGVPDAIHFSILAVNWPNLSTYFKYPQQVRRLIYTTNAIEGFNRQLRKVTKTKSVFPTDDSLFKMLYLAMEGLIIPYRIVLSFSGLLPKCVPLNP